MRQRGDSLSFPEGEGRGEGDFPYHAKPGMPGLDPGIHVSGGGAHVDGRVRARP